MKKSIKKSQVIVSTLAILIAVAGYLSFSNIDLGVKDNTAEAADSGQVLTDIESLDTDASQPGEAVLTEASSFVAQAKVSREQIRSQNKESLLEVINNVELTDEEKQPAVESMVEMTELMEKEAAAELMLESKGFENVVVNLTGDTADVMVPSGDLGDTQRAQIEDIVKRKTQVEGANIVITPMDETQS